MLSRSLSFISCLMIASLLFAACGPVGPSGNAPAAPPAAAASGGGAAQSCPPLNTNRQVSIGNTLDGIEVFADTYAIIDNATKDAWCNVSELAISPVALTPTPPNTALPPCPLNTCLAAVNVDPDSVKIVSGTKPILRYDLGTPHPPKKHPEQCGQSEKCYSIFQRWSGTWKFVGFAKPKQTSTYQWFAEGGIDHMSVFALVELPDPTTITAGGFLTMYIASDFIPDEPGGLGVSVILDGNVGQFDPQGEQRILRFQVDPIDQGNTPEECKSASGIDGMFTCIFPYGAAVEFEYQDNGIAILRNLDRNFEQSFYTSNVELY